MLVEIKDAEAAADVAKALANPTRLRLWRILADKPLSLTEVCEKLGKPVYRESVHRHLEVLVRVGVLDKFYDKADAAIRYRALTESVHFNVGDGRRRA